MGGAFFNLPNWSPFDYDGTIYDLSHLDVYTFEMKDSEGKDRKIAVSFSDHCFTRGPAGNDDPKALYPASTRPVGYFCPDRYQLSLKLRDYLKETVQRPVWLIEGENFAVVTAADLQGNLVRYGIIFSLDRVKKMPVHLDMRVRTAYPLNVKDIITHGNIRFAHLLTLRMQGKFPRRNFNSHRSRP